ncbi:MAG: acetate--CoA ligase family protein [Xanthobacteraceae bacterium]|nr:acetate--CoA ligase family protein [Xanthobacteraceae bacterium]
MPAIAALLAPKSIAVVGASQRRGRGNGVIANLKSTGFKGSLYGVNPRYEEVLGYKCVPSIADLPEAVDCIVVATAADTACDVLDQAYAHGIRAAVVLSAGFGEGGHGPGQERARRVRALAERGMSICGPNCMGIINLVAGAAPFSSGMPKPLRRGPVALVSQSGGLGMTALTPLMTDRELGFAYFVSCGNQLGATVEDFVEVFARDPEVGVIAIVIESLKNPQKLKAASRVALENGKSLVLYQSGQSAAGQIMIQSHTGALASDAAVLAAFLRRCGIVQVDNFDHFVETIELFAQVPLSADIGDEVVVISGSGGGAANAADALARAGTPLAALEPATREQLASIMPEFGSVTNPIDGTGAIYDDPTLLPRIFEALRHETERPAIAASVSARPVGRENMQRLARVIADAARKTERTIVAYSYSPLGGPLDPEIVNALHSAGIPYLLGITNAMSVLKNLRIRRELRRQLAQDDARRMPASRVPAGDWSAMGAYEALVAHGVSMAKLRLAKSEADAVAAYREFGGAVAVKAEAPGLLHKSDLGCVRLNCDSEQAVVEAYRSVVGNARKAGFADVSVLVQPMESGVAEAYAGIVNDPTCGPAICFGLGGIFIEIFKDTTTEMAPLSYDDALRAIRRIQGLPILQGARGRQPGDIDALAKFLVRLGDFAVAHAGQFRALDLNPIIVKPAGQGVVAVDIAVEDFPEAQPANPAKRTA